MHEEDIITMDQISVFRRTALLFCVELASSYALFLLGHQEEMVLVWLMF